jgi:hypothetical protein
MSTASLHRSRSSSVPWPSVNQLAKLFTYATTLAGVYLSVGFLFYYAAKEKLIDQSGTMPAGLKHEFAGSVFATFPGDNVAWILLGAVEAIVVILLAVSLVRGEFLTNRRKPFLLAGLGTAILALGFMGLANDMVGDTSTTAEVFTYAGLTAVLMVLVRQMAPYRPVGWLSGTGDDE